MPVGDYFQEYGPIRRRRDTHLTDGDDERPPRRRPPLSHHPPRRHSLWRLVVVGTAGVLLLLLILPYAFQLIYYDRAFPGVLVEGMPVENLNRQAIQTLVAARHTSFERQPVQLSFHDQHWLPSLPELGMTLDAGEVAERAFLVGRSGSPLRRLSDLWSLWYSGINVQPHLVIDWKQLQAYLIQIAPAVEQPPQDAALGFARDQVIGTLAVTGTQLLVDESGLDIAFTLQSLTPQDVVLRTRPLPPIINNAALQVAQAQAETFLSSTLVFTHNHDVWIWDREKLRGLIIVEPDGPRLRVSVEPERLQEAVQRLSQLLDSGSVEPRLRFTGSGVRIVEDGREGWMLVQPEAVQVISTTLHQRRATSPTTVTLPIKTLYPQITPDNLDELGIVELVGEGKSSFSGSAAYRITNINAGSARFDGVLVAPGEAFSFNTQLGAVDAEHGFVEGYAVIGNRTQLEWGGRRLSKLYHGFPCGVLGRVAHYRTPCPSLLH